MVPEFDKILEAPLSAHETRWASELAEKLPDDQDLSFTEAKILARLPMEEWPAELLLRVKEYINFEDPDSSDEGGND